MEGDINTLGKIIFEDEVKSENSIKIVDSFGTTCDLFEALLMLFTYGMKNRYGKDGKVNLKELNSENYLDFRRRFRTIGITPHYYEYHITQVKGIKGIAISNEEIEDWKKNKDNFNTYLPKKYTRDYKLVSSNKIGDFYFGLKIDNSVYFINFTIN